MTTKNSQTLDSIPSNTDGYYVMIKDNKLGAVGKDLLGESRADIPCNLVMNNHASEGVAWSNTSSPILMGLDLLAPTSYTGINVRHGGPGLVTAAGEPFFTDSFPGPFDNTAAREAIYGVKIAGSLEAESAILSSSEDATQTTYDGLAIVSHDGNCDFHNKLLGVPNKALNPIIIEPFGDIYHESDGGSYQSVEISSTEKPIISLGGRIDVTIELGSHVGAVPKVEINGMHEIDPLTVLQAGVPSEFGYGSNGESYKKEYLICKSRADLAKTAQESRKENCWNHVYADLAGADDNYLKNSSDPYGDAVAFRECLSHPCVHEPEEVYDSCLNSCTNNQSADKNDANDGGSPDCMDYFYSEMGGRPPDEWQDNGCGCGNKDDQHFGCNFKFLVNVVPPQS